MKEIRIAGVAMALTFFTSDEIASESYLQSMADMKAMSRPPDFMQSYIRGADDVIPVLAYSPPSGVDTYFCHYLYWPNGVDRAALDRKVLSGEYTDADFEESVLTQYQGVHCFRCNSGWRALVQSIAYAFGTRIKAHGETRCPECRTDYQMPMIYKVFGKYEE